MANFRTQTKIRVEWNTPVWKLRFIALKRRAYEALAIYFLRELLKWFMPYTAKDYASIQLEINYSKFSYMPEGKFTPTFKAYGYQKTLGVEASSWSDDKANMGEVLGSFLDKINEAAVEQLKQEREVEKGDDLESKIAAILQD